MIQENKDAVGIAFLTLFCLAVGVTLGLLIAWFRQDDLKRQLDAALSHGPPIAFMAFVFNSETQAWDRMRPNDAASLHNRCVVTMIPARGGVAWDSGARAWRDIDASHTITAADGNALDAGQDGQAPVAGKKKRAQEGAPK